MSIALARGKRTSTWTTAPNGPTHHLLEQRDAPRPTSYVLRKAALIIKQIPAQADPLPEHDQAILMAMGGRQTSPITPFPRGIKPKATLVLMDIPTNVKNLPEYTYNHTSAEGINKALGGINMISEGLVPSAAPDGSIPAGCKSHVESKGIFKQKTMRLELQMIDMGKLPNFMASYPHTPNDNPINSMAVKWLGDKASACRPPIILPRQTRDTASSQAATAVTFVHVSKSGHSDQAHLAKWTADVAHDHISRTHEDLSEETYIASMDRLERLQQADAPPKDTPQDTNMLEVDYTMATPTKETDQSNANAAAAPAPPQAWGPLPIFPAAALSDSDIKEVITVAAETGVRVEKLMMAVSRWVNLEHPALVAIESHTMYSYTQRKVQQGYISSGLINRELTTGEGNAGFRLLGSLTMEGESPAAGKYKMTLSATELFEEKAVFPVGIISSSQVTTGTTMEARTKEVSCLLKVLGQQTATHPLLFKALASSSVEKEGLRFTNLLGGTQLSTKDPTPNEHLRAMATWDSDTPSLVLACDIGQDAFLNGTKHGVRTSAHTKSSYVALLTSSLVFDMQPPAGWQPPTLRIVLLPCAIIKLESAHYPPGPNASHSDKVAWNVTVLAAALATIQNGQFSATRNTLLNNIQQQCRAGAAGAEASKLAEMTLLYKTAAQVVQTLARPGVLSPPTKAPVAPSLLLDPSDFEAMVDEVDALEAGDDLSAAMGGLSTQAGSSSQGQTRGQGQKRAMDVRSPEAKAAHTGRGGYSGLGRGGRRAGGRNRQ